MLTVFLTGIRFYAIPNVKSFKLKMLLIIPTWWNLGERIHLFQDKDGSYDKNSFILSYNVIIVIRNII